MELIGSVALSLGLAWASGLNLYAAVLTVGLLGATGVVTLPPDLKILTDPVILAVAAIMFAVEFVADKIPAVDTAWDAIHSFIRIPAGALLAYGAVDDIGLAGEIAALVAGGTLATVTHAGKAGARALINTSPEPFSNWAASLGEDTAVIGGLLLAMFHPVTFVVLLALFVVLLIWLLPKLWRGVRRLGAAIGRLLGARPAASVEPPDGGHSGGAG